MSRPRRRMFGPLFYTTVTAAVLLTACVQLVSCKPMFDGLAPGAVIDPLTPIQ